VAWISGRTSMLGAMGPLFGAVAVGVAARLRTTAAASAVAAAGALLGLLAGLLGKEEALVFAPLLVLLGARRSRALALATAGGCGAALCAYFALRAAALGSPLPAAPFAPLAGEPLATRLRFGGHGLLEGLRTALAPFGLTPNHRAAPGFTPAAPPPTWAWAGWGLALLAVAAALAVLRRERARPGGRARRRRAAAVGALFALAAWAPFTQVLPAGEVFAPRFLYVPLLLAAPAAGLGLLRAPRPLVALLLVACCAGSWSTQRAYDDRESYARAVLAHVPDDVGAWNDLGLALEEQGDIEGALAAWREGLARRPSYARIWSNLGRRQLAEGCLAEAEASLRRAVGASRRNPVARCNLGSVLLRRGAHAEAAEAYADAARLAPGMLAAWRGLANARLRGGAFDACEDALARALALDPADRRSLALRSRLEARRAEEPEPQAGEGPSDASGSRPMEDSSR